MRDSIIIRKLEKEEISHIYGKHLVYDFPKGEVKPLDVILNAYDEEKYFAYGMFEQGKFAAYAFLMDIQPESIYLLDYFAVVSEMRADGYGSIFLKELKQICDKDEKRLVLEVENPDYEDDSDLREMMKKRIAFYEKNEILVSSVTCNFYDNEYRILYSGTPLDNKSVYEKIMNCYMYFFGENFVSKHVTFHEY